MADYLTDLKTALQEAAAREYPGRKNRPSGFATVRAQIRGVTGPQTRAALARISLVLSAALAVAIFVLAVGLLHHGHAQRDRGNGAARHAPKTGPQHVQRLNRSELAIDSALAHGIDPPAPDQSVPLPILGAAGTRTLKDFRGHVVVLNLFASWCDPCKAETATLEQTQTRIERQGDTVLGVAYLDDAAAAESFVRAEHITYPVLRENATLRLARAFGVNGVPETFVIDRDGRIVAARRYQIDERWLSQALARARHAGAR
jgi:cytochrome c biogenesis protein CcmG/thiol:disulfide interchange protein DsbE